MLRRLIGIALGVAVVCIFVALAAFRHDENSIADYSRSCNQANVPASQCTSWNLGQETYFIDRDAQKVMFIGSYGPVALTNCTVANSENWSCASGQGFKGGVAVDNGSVPQMYVTQHFGPLRYWWYLVISRF